jgi:hypothetical protein
MREELVLDVTHSQVVFTLAKMLRVFFKYNRKLLSGLCLCAKKRKEGESSAHPPVIDEEPPFVPSRGWAEMIRKVYEIDSLLCPHCGAKMKVIAFIEGHKIIDNIIDHLKLRFQAGRPPQTQVVQQELLMAAEESGEYF